MQMPRRIGFYKAPGPDADADVAVAVDDDRRQSALLQAAARRRPWQTHPPDRFSRGSSFVRFFHSFIPLCVHGLFGIAFSIKIDAPPVFRPRVRRLN